jgi:hypothetical protein
MCVSESSERKMRREGLEPFGCRLIWCHHRMARAQEGSKSEQPMVQNFEIAVRALHRHPDRDRRQSALHRDVCL